MAGLPIKLSGTPGRVERPAPALGEHTEEVLRDWLGLRAGELGLLSQEGVI